MHMKWKRGAPNTNPTTRNQIGRKRRGTWTKDDNNKIQHNNQSIAGHGIRIVDEISQLIESRKGRERKPQSIPAWIGRIAPSIKRRRNETAAVMKMKQGCHNQPTEGSDRKKQKELQQHGSTEKTKGRQQQHESREPKQEERTYYVSCCAAWLECTRSQLTYTNHSVLSRLIRSCFTANTLSTWKLAAESVGRRFWLFGSAIVTNNDVKNRVITHLFALAIFVLLLWLLRGIHGDWSLHCAANLDDIVEVDVAHFDSRQEWQVLGAAKPYPNILVL